MMLRRWLKVFGTAFGAGLILSAGQLGLAYGLGVLRWDQSYAPGSDNLWSAQLTWVAWIAEVSVVLAAVGGLRRAPRPGGFGPVSRLISVCAATAGAVIAVPLVTVPAQIAHPPLPVNPALVAALTAAAGLLVGLIFAYVVVSVPPISGNALTTIVAVWLFTVATLVIGARPGTPRLGMLDVSGRGTAQAWEIPALAAALSVIVAVVARWGGSGRLSVAVAGTGGPVLLAGAYLIAGSGVNSPGQGDQLNPYRMALIGLGVGALMSVAVALLPPPGGSQRPSAVKSGPDGMAPPALGGPAGPLVAGAPPGAGGPAAWTSPPSQPAPAPPEPANPQTGKPQTGNQQTGNQQTGNQQTGDPQTARPRRARSRPAQPGPARPQPAQPQPAQPGPAQPGPAQPGPAQPEPAPPATAKPRRTRPQPAQPGPAQPTTAKTRRTQAQPAQPAPAQPEPASPATAKTRRTQAQPTQPAPAQPAWPPVPGPARSGGQNPDETMDLAPRGRHQQQAQPRPKSRRHRAGDAEAPSDPHLDWVRDLGADT